MTAEHNEAAISRHWPTMLLGLIVAAIFLVAIFSFRVGSTETAVMTTFGKINEQAVGAGLHFRWPYPFQEIHKFDNRYNCFTGNVGKLEETLTKDGQNIIAGIYIIYKISDPKNFFLRMVTTVNAEEQLNSWMRSVKDETFGKYKFNQLINTNAKEMCLDKIESEMCQKLDRKASDYGLTVKAVGINTINIPKSISEKVFERMVQERKVVAERYRAEGKKEAETIKIDADRTKQIRLAEAEADAKEIRAQGDADAAKYYVAFKQAPELAAFLRKLDSLRKVMKSKTTLVLDTDSAPFDLLKMNADKLKQDAPSAAAVTAGKQ
jgi:membrane protease subunit HflC